MKIVLKLLSLVLMLNLSTISYAQISDDERFCSFFVADQPNCPLEDFIRKSNDLDKYGFINHRGEVVIDFEYDYATNFYDGLSAVQKNGKYGFIDTNNKTVVPFIYDNAYFFSDGLALVQKDGKYGFINHQGNVVIELKYQFAQLFSDGLASVSIDGNKFGAINMKNEIVIPFVYDSISYADFGVMAVEKNGKYGVINNKNEIVIPIIYDELESVNENNEIIIGSSQIFRAVKKNEVFYFNQFGKTISPLSK